MQDWQASIVIEAQAIVARIEGMKAENMYWQQKDEQIPYRQDEFDLLADELIELSRSMRQ